MTQQEKAKKVQELRSATGAMAEACFIFLRAAMAQGATLEEAAVLTRAYTEAMLSDSRRKRASDNAAGGGE